MQIQIDEIKILDDENLLNFIRINVNMQFSDESIEYIMSRSSFNYPRIIYYLSINNPIINPSTFESTWLQINYNYFTEEDFSYICEAIKNQNDLKFYDFYIVLHQIIEKILKYESMQMLLINLMTDGGYRIREYIVSSGIIDKIFDLDLNVYSNKILFVKFIVKAVGMDSPILIEYINSRKLSKDIQIYNDSLYFFKEFVNRNSSKIGNFISIKNSV